MNGPVRDRAAAGSRRGVTAFAAAALILLLLVAWLLAPGGLGAELAHWRGGFAHWLRGIPPWAFALTFAVLPAFGVPLSLYYLTVGAVFPGLGSALAVALGCMLVNMALSFLVARLFSHRVRRFTQARGYEIPSVHDRDQWKVVMTLRASPLPWLMQSWLLTLGGVRFLPYMVFGIPIPAAIGFGLVVVGESLLAGGAGWLLLGVAVVLGVSLGLSRWRRRGARPRCRGPDPASAEPEPLSRPLCPVRDASKLRDS